jgi:hypothetical protein
VAGSGNSATALPGPSAYAGGAAPGSHICSPGCTDRHSAGAATIRERSDPGHGSGSTVRQWVSRAIRASASAPASSVAVGWLWAATFPPSAASCCDWAAFG